MVIRAEVVVLSLKQHEAQGAIFVFVHHGNAQSLTAVAGQLVVLQIEIVKGIIVTHNIVNVSCDVIGIQI